MAKGLDLLTVLCLASALSWGPISSHGFADVGPPGVVPRSRTSSPSAAAAWQQQQQRRRARTSGDRPFRRLTKPQSAAILRSSGSNDPAAADGDGNAAVVVALTRQVGKNAKLSAALSAHPSLKMMGVEFELEELPCVEHAVGPDRDELVDVLSSDDGGGGLVGYDYVVITSPEAAKVLAKAVDEAAAAKDGTTTAAGKLNDSSVKVAAVGKATGKTLTKLGITVDFVPSQANGETLAAELPPVSSSEGADGGKVTRVLYPASAKAADTIKEGLEGRSSSDDDDDGSASASKFELVRLNTYDTIPATFTPGQLSDIDRIDIVCFGSPSSVQAWLSNVDVARNLVDMDEDEKKKLGPDGNGNVLAACIGKTTAQACLESGRWHSSDIYYPKVDPGVDSWAASAAQAMGDVMERKFWS